MESEGTWRHVKPTVGVNQIIRNAAKVATKSGKKETTSNVDGLRPLLRNLS